MNTEQGGNGRRGLRALALGAGVCLLVGCTMDGATGTGDATPLFDAAYARTVKAVGSVEIIWPKSLKQDVPEGEEKLAFVDIAAFPATADRPARGSFTFRVLNLDSTLHREIAAELTGVIVDPDTRKAWYVGSVVSDERYCSGGCSGHDGGDGGDSGGCTDGGTHDDGGCSGGGGDMGGGDTGGGCSDGTDDGGCSGEDGGCSGSGSGGHGEYHVSGKDSRDGQIIVGRLHDGGTPGLDFDGITWKWFHPLNPDLPSIENTGVWPHLCKKWIIGGNLRILPEP